MTSLSLKTWSTARSSALDEIENAHASVGENARGRRYATQQINHAYAVLLSSQFQGFCRDLHSESVAHLSRTATPALLQGILLVEFVQNRKLDTGNPNPGNIGADFNRFGLVFWDDLKAHDARNTTRRIRLDKLNDWRNAISHQDFDPAKLGGTSALRLDTVRSWRQAVHHLAVSFDAVMYAHMNFLAGKPPW